MLEWSTRGAGMVDTWCWSVGHAETWSGPSACPTLGALVSTIRTPRVPHSRTCRSAEGRLRCTRPGKIAHSRAPVLLVSLGKLEIGGFSIRRGWSHAGVRGGRDGSTCSVPAAAVWEMPTPLADAGGAGSPATRTTTAITKPRSTRASSPLPLRTGHYRAIKPLQATKSVKATLRNSTFLNVAFTDFARLLRWWNGRGHLGQAGRQVRR